ncbi:iron chelate uptake ABC transporter family permease subunit [Mumia zhuanghuii]|uniref:FecCD family ABC transporter permease n=2 Tax=Mumia TaxID=1546255 RepID=A0ABW1QHI8_9ACTN|nr:MULTISPECIES: iron chelate uptake ABC transporter family permease subunit [Mumia]KAA1424661.1 iron chelate uptake ABC transporter family permease subunit [Mumia zhuanghuii]
MSAATTYPGPAAPSPADVPTALAAHRRRLRRRTTAVVAALCVVVVGLFATMLTVGSYQLPLADVVASVLHVGDDPSVDFVVQGIRLPVALAALGVGLALGLSGVVFQTLLANPLASPDFVGVSSGASLFAAGAIIVVSLNGIATSVAALVGALVSGLLVYALAWRGGVTGYRFILIGIGISQFMLSITAYLVARADIHDAREAMTWIIGSVGMADPGTLQALFAVLLLSVPLLVLLARPLRGLQLGDDSAAALGVRVEAARWGLMTLAIVLVAFATAAAGPIMFVALVAGPLAHRLLGSAPGALLASALVGAALVMMAELVAAHLLPTALPTGVVTGAVGAPYLLWLLVSANRGGRGG